MPVRKGFRKNSKWQGRGSAATDCSHASEGWGPRAGQAARGGGPCWRLTGNGGSTAFIQAQACGTRFPASTLAGVGAPGLSCLPL